MFRIAICDDDSIVCVQIENILIEYFSKIDYGVEVSIFHSGESLFANINAVRNFDLLFLDIELPNLNGIEIGAKIRKELKNDDIQITYISAKQGYAMELFNNRPLDFIIKPIENNKIIKSVNETIRLNNKRTQYFDFSIGRTHVRLNIKDILYFESMDKKIKVITTSECYEYYFKIANLLEQIEKFDFLQIHQSFVVNYEHIITFQSDSVILTNNKSLPISRSYKVLIKKSVLSHRKEVVKNG